MIINARLVRLSTVITFALIVYLTTTCSGFASIHAILACVNVLFIVLLRDLFSVSTIATLLILSKKLYSLSFNQLWCLL